MLIIPLLLAVIYLPVPVDKAALADFGRFSKAVGQHVALVDVDGLAHDGVVRAASSSAITVQTGKTYRTFQNGTIVSAERLRDSSVDGAIRGALFGLIYGAMASQGADTLQQGRNIALMT